VSAPSLVSIILPVHNQADHIAATVGEYHAALARLGVGYEMILVVNACTDDSARICQDLSDRLPAVATITSAAGGWGLAVRLGLAAARGDLLLFTNSARTSAAELILVLETALANPAAVAKATRHGGQGWRSLGSKLYNLECRVLLGIPWPDVNGTPKAFPRSFAPLLELRRDDDLIDAEFCMICRRNGYPLIEVPIRRRTRHGGASTTRLHSALKMYRGALGLWRSSAPTNRNA
jgi:glycosyltransferase involved in cell wall biosynthesis